MKKTMVFILGLYSVYASYQLIVTRNELQSTKNELKASMHFIGICNALISGLEEKVSRLENKED